MAPPIFSISIATPTQSITSDQPSGKIGKNPEKHVTPIQQQQQQQQPQQPEISIHQSVINATATADWLIKAVIIGQLSINES